MTLQELLDMSVDHLRKQGKPSGYVVDDGTWPGKRFSCMYRRGDLQCAAGIFLKEYSPALENLNWDSLARNRPQFVHDFALGIGELRATSFIMDVLQGSHDTAASYCVEEGMPTDDFWMERFEVELQDRINSWNRSCERNGFLAMMVEYRAPQAATEVSK